MRKGVAPIVSNEFRAEVSRNRKTRASESPPIQLAASGNVRTRPNWRMAERMSDRWSVAGNDNQRDSIQITKNVERA